MWKQLDAMPPKEAYKILSATIVPRPIAWVTSCSEAGQVNVAPFSFFNLMCSDPNLITLGVMSRDGERKDTARNITARGEFVVNAVSHDLLHAMNITSGDYPDHVSEAEIAHLDLVPSGLISVPRIRQSPVAYECKLHQEVEVGVRNSIFIAQVVGVFVADEYVLDGDRNYIDTPKLDLMARMHGGAGYLRASEFVYLDRPKL